MTTVTSALIFSLFGFLLGMLPFSLWLANWSAGADLRQVGDGNPGATNAWRAGGWRAGLPAYLLDITKAALPIGLAYYIFGLRGYDLIPVALAPTLGHIFSPLLGGRGGKGLATILGAWIGISLLELPVVILSGLLLFRFLVQGDAWVILFTELWTLAYLLTLHPDPVWVLLFSLHILLMTWTHRQGFLTTPVLRRRKK
jgi:glycerol-3-phosphate acyltransferase PlsY